MVFVHFETNVRLADKSKNVWHWVVSDGQWVVSFWIWHKNRRTCFLLSGHRPLSSKTANNIFAVTGVNLRTLHANVPTFSRLIFLSFCHAELVSASVRGDVLEMARCEILKQVQDDICVLTAHCSPLTTHPSLLISYLSKNKKSGFWGGWDIAEK